MKKLLAGAALAALVGTPVFAADMPIKAPAPVYTWTGFYLGGNVGWLEMDDIGLSGTPADPATAAFLGACGAAGGCPFTLGHSQGSSVVGGGQFGYNLQFQSWVVGLEADAQGTGVKVSSSAAATAAGFFPYFITGNIKETAFSTIRGRVGYLVTPGLLAYATGGFAWPRPAGL
jgi:outer membrane immunogenic protein